MKQERLNENHTVNKTINDKTCSWKICKCKGVRQLAKCASNNISHYHLQITPLALGLLYWHFAILLLMNSNLLHHIRAVCDTLMVVFKIMAKPVSEVKLLFYVFQLITVANEMYACIVP